MKYNKSKMSNKSQSNTSSKDNKLTYYSSLSSYSSFPLSSSSSIINDLLDYTSTIDTNIIDLKAKKGYLDNKATTDISTTLPLYFNHENRIKIPCKVQYLLRNVIPREILKAIDPNVNVAIEKCLLFTTLLTSTYFKLQEDSKFDGWKALKAEYLQDFFSNSSQDYKNIIKILMYKLDAGSIIECDNVYRKGQKSYNYRLGKAYMEKGIINYTLKSKVAISLLNKRNAGLYNKSLQNPICRNLIQFYSHCTFPTIEEIIIEAKRLIKLSYSKKGKRLVFLNKHPKTYYSNPQKLSFVEDAIKKYKSLTENGLLIPRVGSEKSGGRVVDSIALMPSWIRKLIKVDGVPIVELDYSCLHPNIVIALYGGRSEFITHEKIARLNRLEKSTVKKQNLSFFNATVSDLIHFNIYGNYFLMETKMIEKIIEEKLTSIYGYKITSRRMFKKEVEIMTEVIELLNNENILVGYGYDALYAKPDFVKRIKKVMDFTCLNHGVKTTASV